MKKIVVYVLSALVLVTALVHDANAQRRNDPRYGVLTNSIFHQAAYNGDPSMMNGYGRKTAAELGLTGKEVYNEYPGGPVVVPLNAGAVLLYDTASLEILYLDGCKRGSQNWYNRVKLVTTVTTTTTIVTIQCWDLNGNGIGERNEDRNGDGRYTQEDCVTSRTVTIQCWDFNGNGIGDGNEDRNGDGQYTQEDCVTEAPCQCPLAGPPNDPDFGTSWWGRDGRLAQAGMQVISLEGGVGIGTGAAITWRRHGDVLESIWISAAENASLKLLFSNANRFEATFPLVQGGSFDLKLKKRESKAITVGGIDGVASWKDRFIVVNFPSVPGCFFSMGPENTRVVATFSQGGGRSPEDGKNYVPPGGTNYGDAPNPPPNNRGGGGRRNRNVFQ